MNGTVDITRHVPADEVKALVTVETTERLVRRAHRYLSGDNPPSPENLRLAILLLEEAAEECSIRTCTAVKSMALSDRISMEARMRVDHAVARCRSAMAKVWKSAP